MSNATPTPASTSVPATTPAVITPTKPVVAPNQSSGSAPVVPPKAATPVEETWDVQENGKVIKKTRKEIIEAYQLRQLSDKRRSEADKAIAEYNQVFAAYKADPIKFMKATGVDFENLATSFLAKKAEDAMKDPKVLEAEKLKAENETYKKWVEEQKSNMEKATKEKAIQVERERIHQEIIQEIEESKELGLPIDEELVIAIAQKMLVQDRAKKPLNAKDALPEAYKSTQKWLQGMAAKMEGEKLVAWLGPEVAMKIRKYDLTQLKAKRANIAPKSGSAVKPTSEKKETQSPKYKTWTDFKNAKLDTIQ